jgi:hypothetical protein
MLKIYVENQILEFDNKIDRIDELLKEIDNIVLESSKVINSMLIDGHEIFGDYYDNLLNNIKIIEKVKVIASTYKELVESTLNSTLDYLERVPNLIEALANDFYKSPSSKSWSDLNDLLGGISWIISTFSSIDNDINLKDVVSDYEKWNLYSKEIFSLSEILPDFEDALSSQDNITIADILSYEIHPKFNSMSERLSELVSVEENISDLN